VAAVWVTGRVCPATLRLPVLEEPVLVLTEKETAPFPVPLASEVITNQASLRVAVQGQLLELVHRKRIYGVNLDRGHWGIRRHRPPEV
jgi:hypothetical protein